MRNSKKSTNKANKSFNNKLKKHELEYYSANAMPDYIAQPTIFRTFRFYNSGNGTGQFFTIGRGDLMGLVIAVSQGAGAVLGNLLCPSLFDAIRLKRVRVWGQPSFVAGSSSNPLTGIVAVSYPGPNAPTKTYTASGNAVNRPYIDCKPPAESFAALWSNQSSTTSEVVFELTCSQGDIIEIDVNYTLLQGTNTIFYTPSGIVTTTGLFYCTLDQATSVLIPVFNAWSGA
jgi:hypothetical protein